MIPRKADKPEPGSLFAPAVEVKPLSFEALKYAKPQPDGRTFEPGLDGERLADQHARVFKLMADGAWRTPEAIEAATGDNWASASARLRDFRKDKFGGHTVERRRAGDGLFEYRLIVEVVR